MPGPGGYASLGLSWEEGKEMPVGFAKQRIGYIRVTGNCALCHAVSNRTLDGRRTDDGGRCSRTRHRFQPLLTFFTRCAQDPRFNADDILAQVDTATTALASDRLLYSYVLIPRTRQALLDPAAVLLTPRSKLIAVTHSPKYPFHSRR